LSVRIQANSVGPPISCHLAGATINARSWFEISVSEWYQNRQYQSFIECFVSSHHKYFGYIVSYRQYHCQAKISILVHISNLVQEKSKQEVYMMDH